MQKKSKLLNNKIKMINDKKYFNSPIDKEGNPYWIPIVIRNKDYLLGFINAYHFISDLHIIDINDMEIALSSDRFNDVLINGTRIQSLTRQQLKQTIKKLYFDTPKENHPENKENILNDYYLTINCVNCGMFYAFKNENEVPENDFVCSTCDRTLISYINESDDYFTFDGDSGDIDEIVSELNNENNN